jgi:hypothetical protein
VPPALQEFVTANGLVVGSVEAATDFNGWVLTFGRPTGITSIGDYLPKLKLSLPPEWRVWGAGSTRKDTFYLALEEVAK